MLDIRYIVVMVWISNGSGVIVKVVGEKSSVDSDVGINHHDW